jgi:hypothetical protein
VIFTLTALNVLPVITGRTFDAGTYPAIPASFFLIGQRHAFSRGKRVGGGHCEDMP